jgi:predicted RNA-binding protein
MKVQKRFYYREGYQDKHSMGIRDRLARIFQSLKESDESSVYVPDMELSPEKEDEIIENIVEKVRKYNAKQMALLFFRSYKPMSVYGAQVAPALLSPYFFLMDLFDIQGFNYNAFFMKRENLDRLVEKLEEL